MSETIYMKRELGIARCGLVVKHFNELSTTELYEILKTRAEIFVNISHGVFSHS